jgi:hypothetical protein
MRAALKKLHLAAVDPDFEQAARRGNGPIAVKLR